LRIEVDCEAIRTNTRAVVELCAKHGIEVVGVTKGCCGLPEVARAMLAGGVTTLGDSRISHVRRLRGAGIKTRVMLLRLPKMSEIDQVVELTEVSLNSEYRTIEALSRKAEAKAVVHDIILMVEVGDRREGLMPEEVVRIATSVEELPGVRLIGLGANYGCLGGVLPSSKNTGLLVELTQEVERACDRPMEVISGGSTVTLPLLEEVWLPRRINQLRIGTAILQGGDSVHNWTLPPPCRNGFTLFAEVIEIKHKPSLPEGEIGPDAFGTVPTFEDRGPMWRIILAGGEQDLRPEGLKPKVRGLEYIGASSDHMVFGALAARPDIQVGDEIEFTLAYGALATGMASPEVQKVIHLLKG